MATHDPSPNDTFEQRVQTLTRQTADGVSPTQDAWAMIELRLRQRQAAHRRHWYARLLTGDAVSPSTVGGRSGWRPTVGALSAVVVVSLLLSAFAWVIVTHRVGVIHPAPVSIMQATVHGVTITVDSVYADPTRTLVTFHVDGLTTQQAKTASITPFLLDAYGHGYAPTDGDIQTPPSVKNLRVLMNFDPLAPTEQATPQQLTFYVDTISFAPHEPNTPKAPLLNGPWVIALQVASHIRQTLSSPSAPVTHKGITVQIESTTWAAASVETAKIDGNYDIGSIVLRISGLPHDAESPLLLQSSYTAGGGAISITAPATATLTLADGTTLTPAFVYAINPPLSQNGIHYYFTVQPAPDGAIEAGISFLASAPITPSAFTLSLHNLQIERNVGANGQSLLIQGDWVIQVA